ncbi:MAG: copper-translocating P-type ATPase [Alphaproteobacteria bacterium]|nr:copper-translocating P-type ATPase [Alphaproteobacteria bacterium]
MVALKLPDPRGYIADSQNDPEPFIRRDGKGQASIELLVTGARCANCIAKIEGGLRKLEGVSDARLNLSNGKLVVSWREGKVTAPSILACVQSQGFGARAYDPRAFVDNEEAEGRMLLRCMAVAGFAAANVMLLSVSIWSGLGGSMGDATRTLFHWISGLIAIPAAIYAGRPFFYSARRSLMAGRANMDVPITLAILLALGLSVFQTMRHGEQAYFDAAVMLPFLLLIGRYLDFLMRRKALGAARELAAMQAVSVRRLDSEGHPQSVAARDVAAGDHLLVATGERVAVDGLIVKGESEADISLVTGESRPVSVGMGDVLRAGSIVIGSPLIVKATTHVGNSLVAEISRLVEAGQQNRNRYVRLADRAASIYVPVVHGTALTVFVVWMLFGAGFATALQYAIALLIVTCPCALGLAVPAVQVRATGLLFKRGILVKSGDALERLAEADTAVFDKTGTVTLGHPELIGAAEVPAATLEAAARLARASRHPLARALAHAAGMGPVATSAREVSGEGMEAEEEGVTARLGKAGFVGALEAGDDASELWYRRGDAAPVRFAFDDPLRSDVMQTIEALTARGLPSELLSGDRPAVVARIAAEAGISRWQGAIDPVGKTARLELLRGQGKKVLMVGDGLNDAAALSLAHVSISPGTAVDATQAAADMVLQGEQLAPIAEAVDVARTARRRMLENFALAVAYNLVAVPLAALGLVTPLIAAIAMASSSLFVTANAMRIRVHGEG